MDELRSVWTPRGEVFLIGPAEAYEGSAPVRLVLTETPKAPMQSAGRWTLNVLTEPGLAETTRAVCAGLGGALFGGREFSVAG